jgi:hypothetical protein
MTKCVILPILNRFKFIVIAWAFGTPGTVTSRSSPPPIELQGEEDREVAVLESPNARTVTFIDYNFL